MNFTATEPFPEVRIEPTPTYGVRVWAGAALLAGALGLGNFEFKSSPRGRRHLIQHQVVNI